jgi:transglutaminase-like putative cysteine protease
VSIIEIRHRTRFQYTSEIPTSYNEARVIPAHLPRQRVLASHVDIAPVTWQSNYVDYWGTRVTALEVMPEHQPWQAPGWDELRSPALTDRLGEYLEPSPATEPAEELAEFARETAARNEPGESARLICHFLHDTIKYVPGATTVHTPASHAWSERSGVCQDFAHLAIGALRAVGIPARYVSGYLHPNRASEIGQTVRGESHAWVEWWVGDWLGYDPTNDSVVADHHVVVARARGYADVMPMKGIFTGADSELTVTVDVTQVA